MRVTLEVQKSTSDLFFSFGLPLSNVCLRMLKGLGKGLGVTVHVVFVDVSLKRFYTSLEIVLLLEAFGIKLF